MSVIALFVSGLLVVGTTVSGLSTTSPAISAETLTISGISSGAAMAIQYEFAFSSKVRANGAIAGLPYMCAMGTLPAALLCCNESALIVPESLLLVAAEAAALGNIDSLKNLARHSVLLFSGIDDTIVSHGSMVKVADMMTQAGVTDLKTIFNIKAEHSWVTSRFGNKCKHLGEPFVNNCEVDFAGRFFRQAFNWMNISFNSTEGTYNPNRMISFDQRTYGAMPLLNSLASNGYVYVPSGCSLKVNGTHYHASTTTNNAQCHLHVNFHGCQQGYPVVGTRYVSQTQLNEWAESNNVIIIYPQIASVDVLNPKGCWDWWGYSGENYALQSGIQMVAIDSMIEKVLNSAEI